MFHIYIIKIVKGKKIDFETEGDLIVATKNRQNRQLAESSQTFEMKLVENQILCEKLVS